MQTEKFNILRFCVLCGRTSNLSQGIKKPSKLFLVDGKNKDDLGFVCHKCLKHLEDGGTFNHSGK